jgi:hypothetical protein
MIVIPLWSDDLAIDAVVTSLIYRLAALRRLRPRQAAGLQQ